MICLCALNPEYLRKGHISEKTDAFAMGIVVLELLLASSYSGSQCEPAVLTLEARRMVDERADVDLLAAMEAKSVDCAGCCWSGSSEAKRVARALISVAIKCVKAVQARSTPADVLPELEALGAFGAQAPPLN